MCCAVTGEYPNCPEFRFHRRQRSPTQNRRHRPKSPARRRLHRASRHKAPPWLGCPRKREPLQTIKHRWVVSPSLLLRHQPLTTRPLEPCQNFLPRPYQPRSRQWDQRWEHPTCHRDRPPKRHRIPRNRHHIVGFLPKRVVHYAEVGQTIDRYS